MKKILALFIIVISHAFPANALMQIDITRGNVDPLPIALPYIGGTTEEEKKLGRDIIGLIENDLEDSGLFASINRKAFIQEILSSETFPQFASWRQINAAALLTGDISIIKEKEFDAEFRLWDVYAQQQISGKSYSTNTENWRRIAHLISDEIYQRITGESGYFDTRIVYVAESGPATNRIKRLAIMDRDGANHRYLTNGKHLVITPRFSPKAHEVIYMSYASGVPRVYILDVDTKEQRLLGDFPGMSFAPRFSPDGKAVIMSATLEGNSEIYSMDLDGGNKKRLTFDEAIDTSPSFSPDSKRIVFNSDRGGSQQLYTMDSNGRNLKRISFGKGRYGTPVWSPRGDLIAFTKMSGGRFFIGVMRPDGSGERLLTESFLDEGPTWSPNGRVIMFSRQERSSRLRMGKWALYSIDLTGYNEKKIPTPQEASDPAWSSLL